MRTFRIFFNGWRTGVAILALAAASACGRDDERARGDPAREPPTSAKVSAPAALAATRAELLERVRRGDAPSLAIGVVQGGAILWEEGIGWADRERGLAATPETMYPLASVSKSITATGAMAFVTRGRLRLEDAVGLPSAFSQRRDRGHDAGPVIRLSQLLDHTSGVPHLWHYEYPDRPATLVGRDRLLRQHSAVVRPPGEGFLYTNLGFGAVAAAIERAGAAPFQLAMSRALFTPLAMRRTTVSAWVGADSVVRGYDASGPIPYRYRLAPDGGAGFFSTVDDLLRYARFHLGGTREQVTLVAAAIVRAHANVRVGSHYQQGWGVVRLPHETVLISDGELAGGTAVVLLLTEARLGIVVLCNRTGGPASEAAVAIATALVPGFDTAFQQASVTGWDHGAILLTARDPVSLGGARDHASRISLALWPSLRGLHGVLQEDTRDDRPEAGVPHRVELVRATSMTRLAPP